MDLRDTILRGLVLCGTAVAVITELLSPFHLIRRGPLALAWLLAVAAVLFLYRRGPALPRLRLGTWEAAILAPIPPIAALVGLAAALSPPSSADAMAYHMPRVIYWAQAGSVAFFPTPYFNQIALQPLDEYFMLHAYVLSGGDRLINLVAFGAFLGGIVAVSALAKAMGLSPKAQSVAALFCATLPSGVLQGSGAKNDWMLSLWLVCLVYFTLRRDAPFAGLSLGLALATKATAYLFAPPLFLVALWAGGLFPKSPALWRRLALWTAAGVLLLNGPQYIRNLQLSGSPLGPDSAHGDGLYRWRNEHPGWKSTVSNALRNASEQLGARSQSWNTAVYQAVTRIHGALGIDPQDPDTTWRWARYEPPVQARNHEANASNKWHLLALGAALIAAAAARRRVWVAYGLALVAAFLLFCLYLKWQPYLARLELPLFVLGAPLAAFALAGEGPRRMRTPRAVGLALVCLFLAGGARPSVLENWTRPLKGPHNLFVTSRDDSYFADMSQWDNRPWYLEAVNRAARSGCRNVGIDITEYQLEYPFQALLRERDASVRFIHTGVTNASARYYPPLMPQPCAVLCFECADNQRKIALYEGVGQPVEIGRFLLFQRP